LFLFENILKSYENLKKAVGEKDKVSTRNVSKVTFELKEVIFVPLPYLLKSFFST